MEIMAVDHDLCAQSFYTDSASRCDWGIWYLLSHAPSGLYCDGCASELGGQTAFRPAHEACPDCYKEGRPFRNGFLKTWGARGISFQSHNPKDYWQKYRPVTLRRLFGVTAGREVSIPPCICGPLAS